ncbi:MAG: hypothetical protein KJ077_17025 [Anaerolineae bacterium]|nr:hypothetical protein [Anaerolineae bacterium]
MLTPESNEEFSRARQRAFVEEWLNFFRGRSNNLLPFEEIKQSLQLQDAAYKGLQEIELDKIVGSTGRYRDFTRTFLPKNSTTEDRWRRVDAVAHSGEGFPPIEVYQVGDVYFVRDGNHRVSVARAHGAKTIEAYVIEYKTPVPVGPDDDLDQILLRMEHAHFLKETHLDQLRPNQNVVFTEPGRYRLIEEHIIIHKYLREIACGCEISNEEAVASWYDTVYLPLVELIHHRGVLRYFPGRTEADLYAWLILHRAVLEAELDALGQVSNEQVMDALEREKANPLAQLLGFFQDRLNLEEVSLKAKHAQFLRETRLDEIRPEQAVLFTEPEGYELAKEHIAFHKFLREMECNCEISYTEAVGSWYDHVYLPLIGLIRERAILQYFPGRTESDVYLWLVLRRAACEAELDTLGQIPDEQVIEDLEQQEAPPRSLTRLAQLFGFKPKPQAVNPLMFK